MRLTFLALSTFALACATAAPVPRADPAPALAGPVPAPAPAAPVAAAAPPPAAVEAPPAPAEVAATAAAATEEAAEATEAADEDEAASDTADVDEVTESREDPGNVSPELRYTRDISDAQLAEWWRHDLEKLGSVSFGFVDEGRMVNAERMPSDPAVTVVVPEDCYATRETIDFLLAAARRVHEALPEAPPLRVNHISAREGGYLRPHQTHQNGRDVDLGFFYKGGQMVHARERERYIDLAQNWALLKALVTLTDVQLVLVDKRVQRVLYDYALSAGEDKAWLDTLFFNGPRSVFHHARRHRDHFHVRFFNPRAQELGRRLAPLLAERPEQNLAMHRVKRGDTLGHIALRYGSSVEGIRKVNHLKGSFLRLAQVLKIPLRAPCTKCPIPPPVEVPARRLPQGMAVSATGGSGSTPVAAAPVAAAPVAAAPVAAAPVAAAETAPASPEATPSAAPVNATADVSATPAP